MVWNCWTQMQEYTNRTFNVLTEAEGTVVKNSKKREYIDAISTMINCNIGYGNKRVIEAITDQLHKMSTSSLFLNSNYPAFELAQQLISLTNNFYRHVFYTNSGSEAVEAAIKVSRQYFSNQNRDSKLKILSLEGAYHGCTYGALSACGIEYYKRASGPLLKGFINIPVPDMYHKDKDVEAEKFIDKYIEIFKDTVEKENPKEIAAFIFEPIQLSNAVNILPKRYIKEVFNICKKNDILVIADEIATGFGRTGNMFAVEELGFYPDIMVLAKGITSGYVPLGAMLVTDNIYNEFISSIEENKEFSHGHTTSGNAVACRAGLENIRVIIDEDLVNRAKKVGSYLYKLLIGLNYKSVILDIRGKGLMFSIRVIEKEFFYEARSEKINIFQLFYYKLLSKGVLTYPDVNNSLLIAPPLIIEEESCRLLCRKLQEAVDEIDEFLT